MEVKESGMRKSFKYSPVSPFLFVENHLAFTIFFSSLTFNKQDIKQEISEVFLV